MKKNICSLLMVLLFVPLTFCYGQSKPTRNKANDRSATTAAKSKNNTSTSSGDNKYRGTPTTKTSKSAQAKPHKSTSYRTNSGSYVSTNKKANHYLTVNGSTYAVSYSFENTKGSKVLSVSSDENWWYTNPASWCTIRRSGSTITIEYTGNSFGYIRGTEFYVKTNSKSIKVSISQKGTPPAKVIAQSSQNATKNSGYNNSYRSSYNNGYSSRYTGSNWYSRREYDNYHLIYGGYNHLIIGGNIGGVPGFNAGYEYNFSIAKSCPIYVSMGLEMAFNLTEENSVFAINFPVNFTYLHTFDNDMFIGIKTGLKFRFNCMADDYNYNSYFDTKGFKHFQIGWEPGVSIGYKRVGFGFYYNGYNKIAPNHTSNGFTVDMLYKF